MAFPQRGRGIFVLSVQVAFTVVRVSDGGDALRRWIAGEEGTGDGEHALSNVKP